LGKTGFRNGFSSFCALALAITLWPSTGGAETVPSSCKGLASDGSFSLRVFRDTDGLPQDTIQSLTLDTNGFLWAGTQDGAARFDGRIWRPFPLPERVREDDFIRCILGTEDGSIWFGTRSNGLYRLRDERWTWYREQFVDSGRERVNTLLETPGTNGGHVLWVGTHTGGLARFDGKSWTWFTTANGLPSNEVWGLGQTTGPQGETTLWVGTRDGVTRLKPGASHFETGEGFPRQSVNSFLVTRDGQSGGEVLWAGSYGGGIYRFADGQWTRLTRQDGLGSNFLTSLTASKDPRGRTVVWAGTDGGGLARIVDGRIRMLGMADGFPSNAVYSLLATTAKQGAEALWAGLRNGGLVRLMEGKWQRVWPAPAGRIVPVLSVARSLSPSGCPEYWVGTDGAGLHRWKAGSWQEVPALRQRTVQCLLTGADGTVWAGTRTRGLAAVTGDHVRFIWGDNPDVGCDMIQALAETGDARTGRTLWIGTRQGLYRRTRGRIEHVEVDEDRGSASVTVLLPVVDPDNETVLWAGIGGRLARLDGKGWRIFGPENGLYHGRVQCLMLEETGEGQRLWVGSDGAGVTVLDVSTSTPRHVFSLRAGEGNVLSNDVIYWIGEDREHRIYILTNRGVTRLCPRGEEVPSAPDCFDVTIFTADDGLPSNQGSRGAGIVEPSGRILVGTADGCALLDPSLSRPDHSPKRLVLVAHLEGQEAGILAPGSVLAHDQKHVHFEATLLSLFRGWDTLYRMELVGFDDAPSRWKLIGIMEYRNLPAGRYVFRVWARDYAGNVSGPEEFPFEVAPAPWQTWWARSLILLLLATLVWAGVNLRIRAVRAKERLLASLVEQRTQELAEANARLEELVREDPLTGLANRRAFDEALSGEWGRSRRTGEPLSLILVDIDRFKDWNDSQGHPAGDIYLKRLGEILTRIAQRTTDLPARIGGDEFAILLPQTSVQWAEALAEEIRESIENIGLKRSPGSRRSWPTISCGVAVSDAEMSGYQELLELADRCLYSAKKAGGNCVVSQKGSEIDWLG